MKIEEYQKVLDYLLWTFLVGDLPLRGLSSEDKGDREEVEFFQHICESILGFQISLSTAAYIWKVHCNDWDGSWFNIGTDPVFLTKIAKNTLEMHAPLREYINEKRLIELLGFCVDGLVQKVLDISYDNDIETNLTDVEKKFIIYQAQETGYIGQYLSEAIDHFIKISIPEYFKWSGDELENQATVQEIKETGYKTVL